VWGQLTILELKLLINLALQQFEEAHELVEAFLQYNENTVERGLFYQALNVVLEVLLDDELELDGLRGQFPPHVRQPRMDAVLGSVDGSVRFLGLTPTSMKLEGLDRHQRLIDSYKKLHTARASGFLGIVIRLQPEPECAAGAEEGRQAQGRVRRDPPLAGTDRRDPCLGDAELLRQPVL
jgi:hypothetical protein